MLVANHCTENGVPNGGVRERVEGTEVVYNLVRTTISTNQNPPELPRTKPPSTKPLTKEYTWEGPCLQPHM